MGMFDEPVRPWGHGHLASLPDPWTMDETATAQIEQIVGDSVARIVTTGNILEERLREVHRDGLTRHLTLSIDDLREQYAQRVFALDNEALKYVSSDVVFYLETKDLTPARTATDAT